MAKDNIWFRVNRVSWCKSGDVFRHFIFKLSSDCAGRLLLFLFLALVSPRSSSGIELLCPGIYMCKVIRPLGALLIEFKSRLNVFWKLLSQIRNAADDVLFLIIIYYYYYYHFNWNGNNIQRYTKHNRKKILTMIELQ